MKYIKPLDGLRALAVFLVILSHYFSKAHWINFLPNGAFGVNIFFVLSGFLITNILFGYRAKIQQQTISLSAALKTFYWRRSLRIFPIYYLYILLFFAIGYTSVKDNLWYYLTYSANFLYFFQGTLAGTVSPVWSLAVEEQFYLIWPIVVLLCPQFFLKKLLLFFIAIGLCTKVFFANTVLIGTLPLYSYDAFGVGGLLAYWYFFSPKYFASIKWFLPLGIICFLLIVLIYYNNYLSYLPISEGLMGIFSCCFIGTIIQKSNSVNFLTTIFSNNVMVYLGRISYGLYLYHTSIPAPVKKLVSRFPVVNNFYQQQYVAFVINFSVAILVASISWYFIEKPLIKYKDKFSFAHS